MPVLTSLLGLYVGIYYILSSQGQWRVAARSSSGMEWYEWAPRYFIQDGMWNQATKTFFAPVYYIDRKVWHNKKAFAIALLDGKVHGNWRGDIDP